MPKAPITGRPRGLSEEARRFQFIEPIASPKTLVIVGEQFLRTKKKPLEDEPVGAMEVQFRNVPILRAGQSCSNHALITAPIS